MSELQFNRGIYTLVQAKQYRFLLGHHFFMDFIIKGLGQNRIMLLLQDRSLARLKLNRTQINDGHELRDERGLMNDFSCRVVPGPEVVENDFRYYLWQFIEYLNFREVNRQEILLV